MRMRWSSCDHVTRSSATRYAWQALSWEEGQGAKEPNTCEYADNTTDAAMAATQAPTGAAAISPVLHGGTARSHPLDEDVDESKGGGGGEQAGGGGEGIAKPAELTEEVVLSSAAVLQRVAGRLGGYRLPPSALEVLRETLEDFKGTKNYHNYTRSRAGTDSSCNRWV